MRKGKKLMALALAGVMSFGVASVSLASVSEAATHHEEQYADGTTNKYSHELKEENAKHEQNVRTIRYEFSKDGDQKKYDKAMKKEQQRHDKVVAKIKANSDAHVRHTK